MNLRTLLPVLVLTTFLLLLGCSTAPDVPAEPAATATPDIEATIEAKVKAVLTAVPTLPQTTVPSPTATRTPAPTSTPTVTPTPTPTPVILKPSFYEGRAIAQSQPVSYTHLTLPTNREV